MEPLELDNAIEELETRVERLRALYEQYFMGFEKIPPAVVHKDVERRIYTLRREQIRNTAKRFKLQTIIQRYNTFHQYWQRILREIENGTYKRHVLRAERNASLASASKGPSPIASDTGMPDATVESENAPSSRARKSISPSAPRQSIPASLRHSTRPPPEKIEAFTRALERDLAAALDGDLDFGQLSTGRGDDSLDLDEKSPHSGKPRKPAPRPLVIQDQENLPATAVVPREGLPRGHLRLPAQSSVGGHRLPPAQPKLPARAVISPPPATPMARPAVEPRAAQASTLGPSADRVSQLHRDLLEAKAKTADAGTVSLNALTRKLEATVKLLSEKHAGKRIDFAVVIKEGKAVVKPIVR